MFSNFTGSSCCRRYGVQAIRFWLSCVHVRVRVCVFALCVWTMLAPSDGPNITKSVSGAEGGSIDLNWTNPASAHGRIVSYTVYYQEKDVRSAPIENRTIRVTSGEPCNDASSCNPATYSHKLHGLGYEVNYLVWVVASTSAGPSPASNLVQRITYPGSKSRSCLFSPLTNLKEALSFLLQFQRWCSCDFKTLRDTAMKLCWMHEVASSCRTTSSCFVAWFRSCPYLKGLALLEQTKLFGVWASRTSTLHTEKLFKAMITQMDWKIASLSAQPSSWLWCFPSGDRQASIFDVSERKTELEQPFSSQTHLIFSRQCKILGVRAISASCMAFLQLTQSLVASNPWDFC